jgi:hypothetical protein
MNDRGLGERSRYARPLKGTVPAFLPVLFDLINLIREELS